MKPSGTIEPILRVQIKDSEDVMLDSHDFPLTELLRSGRIRPANASQPVHVVAEWVLSVQTVSFPLPATGMFNEI